MNDRQKELLIYFIRVAMGIENTHISVSAMEIHDLLEIASKQSILYMIIVGLKKLGYSANISEKIEKETIKAQYDYIQRKDSLSRISKAFDESAIDYIPLKGAVLCDYYPQPFMRTSADIDVLIRERDIDLSRRVLESMTDFKYYRKGYHDIHFVNNRIHLELHFSLLSSYKNMDIVLKDAWNYAFCVGNRHEYRFATEYHIFYIASHAAKHFIFEGGIGVRAILDLWLLRTKEAYDETIVIELCETAGIVGFYRMCCNLIDAWFSQGEYSETLLYFEKLVISGGVFGSEHIKLVARERNNSGAKYFFSRVFRTNSDIKLIFPVCNRWPILIPFCQIWRWIRFVSPSRRRAVRKEILHVRTIKKEEVESYDKLLKEMGW